MGIFRVSICAFSYFLDGMNMKSGGRAFVQQQKQMKMTTHRDDVQVDSLSGVSGIREEKSETKQSKKRPVSASPVPTV